MKKMLSKLSLIRDTRGASMVEYMVLVGVIGIVALGAFKLMGSTIVSKVGSQTQQLGTVGAASPTNGGLGTGFGSTIGSPTTTGGFRPVPTTGFGNTTLVSNPNGFSTTPRL
jgi:pilus assembly protein Flp/PilA